MSKSVACTLGLVFVFPLLVWGQQGDLETELRAELADLKARIDRMEVLLEEIGNDKTTNPERSVTAARSPDPSQTTPRQPKQAPALNTPPMLPPSSAEAFKKDPPRFDVLIQSRANFFADTTKQDTFILRKAEVGVKGHITSNVDFSLELDPVRPSDPLRRTYSRLTHVPWLHLKLGLEKAPIGLEELTSTAQLPFVDRSEVNDRFAAAEEVGVHLESRWSQWLFQLAVTNGGRRLLRDNNNRKDLTARVVWAPRPWLSLGLATLQGKTGSEEEERNRYNLEFKAGSNLSGFQSEFYRAKDGNILSSAYYLAGHWAFPVSRSWLTYFQPVIRYEQIDRSNQERLEELRLLTFGFSLLFDEQRSKFQMNYLKDLLTGSRKDEFRAQYQIEF